MSGENSNISFIDNSQGFEQTIKNELLDFNNKFGEIIFNELLNRLELRIRHLQNEFQGSGHGEDQTKKLHESISDLMEYREKLKNTSHPILEISEWESKLQQLLK